MYGNGCIFLTYHQSGTILRNNRKKVGMSINEDDSDLLSLLFNMWYSRKNK